MTMEKRTEILLVGETAQSCLQLMQWLERRGCRCHFASSCKDACRLVSGMRFDFVLSHFELRSAYPLLQKRAHGQQDRQQQHQSQGGALNNGKPSLPEINNQANFQLVRDAIDDQAQDFNLTNLMAMLFRGGLGLAPNQPEVANELMQQRDDVERDRLAEIVVDAMRSWRTQGPGGSIVLNYASLLT
jgi:hypothetical protein